MFGQNGKLCHSYTKVTKIKLHSSWVRDHIFVNLDLNVGRFDHNCGCIVNGDNFVAAF